LVLPISRSREKELKMRKYCFMMFALAILGVSFGAYAQNAVSFRDGTVSLPAGMVEKHTVGFKGDGYVAFGEPLPSSSVNGKLLTGYIGNGWFQHKGSPYEDRIGDSKIVRSGENYTWKMPDWAREEFCGSDYQDFMFNVSAEPKPGTGNWLQLQNVKGVDFKHAVYEIPKWVDEQTPRPGKALKRSAIAIPRAQICK
jgi:hypothetical protein